MNEQKRNQSVIADKSPAEIATEKIFVGLNSQFPIDPDDFHTVKTHIDQALTAERSEAAVTQERHDQMAAFIVGRDGNRLSAEAVKVGLVRCDENGIPNWFPEISEAAKRYEDQT